ncbi:hypothetical protein ACMFMG_011803 [Clarireedia jacksonii]
MASAPQTIMPPFLDQLRCQSLDDFIQKQDEIQAQLQTEIAAESQARSVSASPAHKKTKILPDLDVLRAERDALEETGDTNWVGRLMEYHQANRLSHPSYTDLHVGQVENGKFSSSLKIPENPEPITTTLQKDAKQHIAKLAVDWLIAQNCMPSDGSVKFPKSPQTPIPSAPIVQNGASSSRSPFTSPSPAAQAYSAPTQSRSPSLNSPLPHRNSPSPPQDSSSSSAAAVSCATQVPALCIRLGFTRPTYNILPTSPGTAFYYGWADFGSDPRIEGKVGVFRDVYGKKNAKEVCARGVLSFLRDIERQRLEGIEERVVVGSENLDESP